MIVENQYNGEAVENSDIADIIYYTYIKMRNFIRPICLDPEM